MSSVECLREFVNERLTAAAEEIFRVFKRTIVEYEEEIDRQRKLLDVVWKPHVKLQRIEPEQLHVTTEESEEALPDQQIPNQESSFSLDDEDPEPPKIKVEQEELSTCPEGEQLVLKDEIETFIYTPTYEESNHSEPEVYQRLVSHNPLITESHGQKVDRYEDLGLDQIPETSTSHGSSLYNPNLSDTYSITQSGNRSFQCDTCGKDFSCISKLHRHQRTHTGERPYLCNTCGKRFCDLSVLKRHMSVHTVDKPCFCSICGKVYSDPSVLKRHMSIHTGERPFSCKVCGKCFRLKSVLKAHMRTHAKEKQARNPDSQSEIQHQQSGSHSGDSQDQAELLSHLGLQTGERPYLCMTCGKAFSCKSKLSLHVRSHTGEKPFYCKTCGKRFLDISGLKRHMRIHTGEKPFPCEICGMRFRHASTLKAHMRTHTGEKPYVCTTCGKHFGYASTYLSHMKAVGDSTLMCQSCTAD